MKIAILAALVATAVMAQTALDPLNGINASGTALRTSDYLGVSCGGVHYAELEERANPDGTINAMFRFSTRCSTGGRGAPVRNYLACWDITFTNGFVSNRNRVLLAAWRSGAAGYNCPAL